MEIEVYKDSTGIKTDCPNDMGTVMFGEFLIHLAGGWNCKKCPYFEGIKDVSTDGNRATVICSFEES